jgi:hypothetical protein
MRITCTHLEYIHCQNKIICYFRYLIGFDINLLQMEIECCRYKSIIAKQIALRIFYAVLELIFLVFS